ncbi:hypothetical protein AB0L40_10440 [Patulibacter sp. NPDC049589]|uniref:hypothetical protein n=1 Tax=Patulibacter sp. NPDC049589 TaxID=3154731 RepID=UPI003424DFFB
MATRALDHQERRVPDLRTRTSALLAAASLTASFLGGVAIREDGLSVFAILALAALVLTAGFALAVLWPAQLLFAIDPEEMYAELYDDRDDPAVYLRRAANALREAHAENLAKLDLRDLWFRISAILLGAQTLLWALALAVS